MYRQLTSRQFADQLEESAQWFPRVQCAVREHFLCRLVQSADFVGRFEICVQQTRYTTQQHGLSTYAHTHMMWDKAAGQIAMYPPSRAEWIICIRADCVMLGCAFLNADNYNAKTRHARRVDAVTRDVYYSILSATWEMVCIGRDTNKNARFNQDLQYR